MNNDEMFNYENHDEMVKRHLLLRGLYIVCCLNREAHFKYKSSIIHSFMINDKQVNVHIYTYNMYLSWRNLRQCKCGIV